MIATKKQINNVSKYLWMGGHGSKTKLCKAVKIKNSELSRMLRGGTISLEKLALIMVKVSESKTSNKK